MRECILCGHEDAREFGEIDPVDGDWYCDMCIDTAPAGETPL